MTDITRAMGEALPLDMQFKYQDMGDGTHAIVQAMSWEAGEQSLAAAEHRARHIALFGGFIWYVNADGDDSNAGHDPDDAFATIGTAIAAAAMGDAISIKAGIYAENVDMNLTALELWAEIGATLIGTLSVSADACRVCGLLIAATGGDGLILNGNQCVIEDTKVVGISIRAFDIGGYQNILRDCKAVGYTSIGYCVQNYNIHLYRCIAQGADAATRGFCFLAAADACTLENCISVGNAVAGYEFMLGAANTSIVNCSSGSGDGRWVDTDHTNSWQNFTFDNIVFNAIALDSSGTYNIFRITGVVQVNHIYGIVQTTLPAATTAASLQLFPVGGAAVQLTSLAGSNISNLPIGSMINKAQAAAVAITVSDSTPGFVSEQVGFIFSKFAVGQAAGIETFIRLNVTEANAEGVIDWHIDWEPLSNDGFVEAA